MSQIAWLGPDLPEPSPAQIILAQRARNARFAVRDKPFFGPAFVRYDHNMSRRLPSLTALRAFEAAARHENLTRAAEELFVTHGAISRQIRDLDTRIQRTNWEADLVE